MVDRKTRKPGAVVPRQRTRTKEGTARMVETFLTALAKNPVVREACRVSGLPRTTVYMWKQRDPEFAKRIDEVLDQSLDDLEFALTDRALNGWKRPVFQQGQLVGHEQVFDNRAAEFILGRRRPDRWADRSQVDVNVTVDRYAILEDIRRRRQLSMQQTEVIDVESKQG